MSLPLFTDPRRARAVWLDWAKQSGLPMGGEDDGVSATFLPELAAYCELVSGPCRAPIGLVTRGEDESFTSRATALMRDWDIPAEAVAQYREQAEFFVWVLFGCQVRPVDKLRWSSCPTAFSAAVGRQIQRKRRVVLFWEFGGLPEGIAELERTARELGGEVEELSPMLEDSELDDELQGFGDSA